MDKLEVARDGPVAILTLTDPATMNAVGPSLCRALIGTLERLTDEGGVRAAILTGRGRAFCSGANLIDAAATLPAGGGLPHLEAVVAQYYNPLLQTLRDLPFPLVTAINGAAAGIGCAFALAGDLVLAAEGAMFSTGFRKVGLVPDGGTTWILPRLVGRARAAEMMLLGEPVPAAQALAWGMINRVVPDAVLMDEALRVARDLAEGPASISATRRLIWQALDRCWADQLSAEAVAQGEAGRTADFKEGVTAFLAKRPPRFSGT